MNWFISRKIYNSIKVGYDKQIQTESLQSYFGNGSIVSDVKAPFSNRSFLTTIILEVHKIKIDDML